MKQLNKELRAVDVDSSMLRLKCAVDVVGAVHMAMDEGNTTAETWIDALFGAWLNLETVYKELENIVYVEDRTK